MRLLWFAAVALLVVRAAAAEPAYPETDVDRPLLQYGGMTSLDLGLDFPTFLETTIEPSGAAITSKSSLGHYHDADVVLSHSFGPVEVGARILGNPSGPYAQARLLTYLGPVPGAVTIEAQIKAPQPDSVIDHEYAEDVAYTYKVAIVPHELALIADVNLDIIELGLKPFGMAAPSGTEIFGGVGLTAEAQILPAFSISTGVGVDGPLRQPADLGTGSAELETSMSLRYVLGHWDFYAQLGMTDITSERLPFVNIGAVHRWGG